MNGEQPARSSLVLDVVRAIRDQDGEVIEGDVALSLARLLHANGLDSPGQWGNAYLRCCNCDEARDPIVVCMSQEAFCEMLWNAAFQAGFREANRNIPEEPAHD